MLLLGEMLFFLMCLQMTDFKTPIVLDTGSGLMKAGFADQDFPNVVFPTIIGIPKYEVGAIGNTTVVQRGFSLVLLLSNRTHNMFCPSRK